MDSCHASQSFFGPALVLACLSCLQPGIDPIFLALLSSAHGTAPALHGWIVAATQAGMALGSLVAWRCGVRLPERTFLFAAFAAVGASAATVQADGLPLLIGLRFAFGSAMGLLYTQAMSSAAARRPSGAYGAVFLLQLLLSAIVALLLPALADLITAKAALAALSLVPLAALTIMLAWPRTIAASAGPDAAASPRQRLPVDAGAWALALATLLFIGATMLIWSVTAGLAAAAGVGDATVGRAVAIGSAAGALAALAVMRERSIVPPALSGVLAGAAMLCPIAFSWFGGDGAFLAAIVAFNIGSTAIIIRCSGLAAVASVSTLFRRFVTCTHPLGMTLGPIAASGSTLAFGRQGLVAVSILIVSGACILLCLGASLQRRKAVRGARVEADAARHLAARASSFDVFAPANIWRLTKV